MQPITPLYFPYTTISSPRQYPIFLLFSPLHLLQPVENGEKDDRSTDTFMNSPFCQVHTPCPLGADGDRFRRLIGDIARRSDDYPRQLAALTLAELSTWHKTGEDSERAIGRALRGEIEEPQAALLHREKLWLARLILAIGELLDRQEEEISGEMAQISAEEAGLFRELHGEEEGDDEEEGLAANLMQRTSAARGDSASLGKRFAAWRQLFREAALADCNLLLTTSRAAGDLLVEAYERRCGQPPTLLTVLSFPEQIGKQTCDQTGSQEAEALAAATAFNQVNQPLLVNCRQSLAAMACSETGQSGAILATLEEQLSAWHKQLATAFPSSRFGRRQYRLFLLSGLSATALLDGKKDPAESGSSLLLAAG